jgi:hypothetical protein
MPLIKKIPTTKKKKKKKKNHPRLAKTTQGFFLGVMHGRIYGQYHCTNSWQPLQWLYIYGIPKRPFLITAAYSFASLE